MGMVDAVKSVYSNYVNFKGRASRSEYWWFYLFYMIIYVVLGAMSGAFSMSTTGQSSGGIAGIILMLFYLGTIIPFIAVLIRRMHDVDKSGWFCLIPFYNLYLSIIKGTDGPNRFGDDPVGGIGNTFD